jgi:hypothetical protein
MKEYRQNSHALLLAFWAFLCTATAIVLFVHSHKVVSRALKVEEVLVGVALLIFGPAALAAYLLRARHVWVSVDQLRGIVVSGRRVIPWDDITAVERRRPLFRKSTGPFQPPEARVSDILGGSDATGCVDVGCIGFVGELFIGIVILVAAFYVIWLLFFVVLPLLLLPVVEVFAPFGDRFKIITRQGTLVLRDLREADEFMRQIEQRKPVQVR